MLPTVLVVDDDPRLARTLCRVVRRLGYESLPAFTAEEALDLLAKRKVDLVLTDVVMPGLSGIEMLARLRQAGERIPVVVMSGTASLELAVEAVKLGAYDFMSKPIDEPRLEVALRNASAHQVLVREQERGKASPLIGQSRAMRELRALIERVGPSEGRVLVTGENGTGKELVAEAIHRASPRSGAPFVAVNCAAIPEGLVESALFGHKRGSFTGAVDDQPGHFLRANGGTLFLDEIGDMPAAVQSKLLRVLQTGEMTPVGGKPRPVDVRIVAATHQPLERLIQTGDFREDLYYRLAVVPLHVPALRDRLEDLPELIAHFAEQTAARSGRRPLGFSEAALARLSAHDYPGNVRELQNTIERLDILVGKPVVEVADLVVGLPRRRRPRSKDRLYQPGHSFKELVARAELRILEEAIGAHDGNKSAAARELGMERSHLHKKLRQGD